jgi:alkylhydroperoxidase family enzyme
VKRLGLDNEAIGEIMAVVDVFNGTNRIANGYRIEPDVSPDPD